MLVAAGELDAEELADAALLHGDSVEGVGAGHSALVVGDDHELALADEAVEQLDEAADVRLVERCVHFVEHAEGGGLHHVDGEEEGHRRHGALAAGEERDALELLAGRLGDDLDAALERVALVHEDEVGLTAREELGEHLLEVHADLLEGLREEFLGGLVDAGDRFEELGLAVDEVGVLLLEELVTLLEFVEFLNGVEVDGAHGIDPLGQFGHDQFDPLPRDLGGNRARSGRLEHLHRHLFRILIRGRPAFDCRPFDR